MRPDGEIAGVRPFVTNCAHCGPAAGKTVWLRELVRTESSGSLVASTSESLEAAMGEVEERLWELMDKGRVR